MTLSPTCFHSYCSFLKLDMAHACNPNPQKAEAEGLPMCSRPAWLQIKIPSPRQNKTSFSDLRCSASPSPYPNPQDVLGGGGEVLVVSGRSFGPAPQSHASLQSPQESWQGPLTSSHPIFAQQVIPPAAPFPQSLPCQLCHLQCHLLMSSPPKMCMSREYAP